MLSYVSPYQFHVFLAIIEYIMAVIKDYNLGVYVSFDNKFLIKKTLFKWFTENEILYNPSNIEEFNRENIAKSYLKKLRSLK